MPNATIVAVANQKGGVGKAQTPTAERGETIQLLETPEGILDSPAWHLRMTRN